MPVFEAADAENPPLHMPDWDDDEFVYLRPHVTHLMDVRARGKALLLPDGMTTEQLRAMSQAEVESLMQASTDNSRVDEQILLDMIERWTVRRLPTAAQRAKGERGDVMPLSHEAIRQLPPSVGAFLRAAIDKRRDIVRPEEMIGPDGDDFRRSSHLPGQGLLSGPREPAGAPHGAGGRDRGENGLDARSHRRLSRGAPAATDPVLEREG